MDFFEWLNLLSDASKKEIDETLENYKPEDEKKENDTEEEEENGK